MYSSSASDQQATREEARKTIYREAGLQENADQEGDEKIRFGLVQ